MTPTKQRIAIAEACGWRFHPVGPEEWEWLKVHPDDGIDDPDRRMIRHQPLPDYRNDLSTMHEAEEVLTDDQRGTFAAWLEAITSSCVSVGSCDPHGTTEYFQLFKVIHATAAQRAEAFLRTIGKWEDGT